MRHIPEYSDSVSDGRVMPDHQLPSGLNKIERVTEHSKGLVDDVKSWFDLKIELVKLEVQDQIETRRDEIILMIAAGFIGFLGLAFGLIALALGIGAWLGHPAWGFLIVTIVLFVVAGVLWASRKPRKAATRELDVPSQQVVSSSKTS